MGEEDIANKRSLLAHQTKVQNELDLARHSANTLLAADTLAVDNAIKLANFNINTLKASNGPRVRISELQEESCTTDQFGRITCTKSSASSKFVADSSLSST